MSGGAELIAQILADDGSWEVRPEGTGSQQVLAFTIARSVLLPLLEKAITVVPTREVMPVLKCFQIHVDPQLLRIVASDAERTLLVSTRAVSAHWPGLAVFPAKKLLEIVKAGAADEIRVNVTGTVASIQIGPSLWTLTLPSGADYPAMPAVLDAAFVTVDREVFQAAVGCVRYAASRDPNRANLAVIDITDGVLTASDGTRVQQVTVEALNLRMRIPIDVVDDLLRLLKFSDRDTMHVGQSDTKLIFRFGADVFIVSKVHANFPDMQAQLLRPALENKHTLTVNRAALLAAIRRVRINADHQSAGIALTAEDNTLTVSTRDKYGNTAAEQVPAQWSGGPRVLVVHHGFLTEMITTYGEETCAFRLGDDTKTRRSPLMLRHVPTGSVAVTQQMQDDWASR